MHDGHAGQRCLGALTALFLLAVSSVPGAGASEWDRMRERQRDALRAAEGRIAEIESKERAGPADREKLADKITRDRIARVRASLKSGGESRRLVDAAERGSKEAKALVDVYEGQDELVVAVTREWGANGAERRKLREARATLQRELELIKRNLALAIEALGATAARVPESGILERLARSETAASEVGERLSARWQREYAAREREREQREREAAARERGVR
jgi:hypothetical protein